MAQVWVTREESADGPLGAALLSLGLTPVVEPVIARRVLTDAGDMIAKLSSDDWLVLTSPFAVRGVHAELARVPKVAVVGDSSRQAAEARGMRVALVSPTGDSAGLWAALRTEVPTSGRICFPRSSMVTPPDSWGGVVIDSAVLYETAPRPFDRERVSRCDIVAVASPSAVRAIGQTDIPLASIGGTTSAAIRELGMTLAVEASEPSFAALARAIADYVSSN